MLLKSFVPRLLLTAVALLAFAVPASAAGQTSCTSSLSVTGITITGAHQSTYVGDQVQIRAAVTSVCQLQGVRADGLGNTVALTLQSGEWRGTLSLAGRPHGPFTLTVTATDINGTTAERTLDLTHDTPPVVTLTRPTPSAVGRPLLRVTASCSDDGPGGCTSLQVRTGGAGGDGQLLASGTSAIDQDVSLAAYDGRQGLTLIVYGRDAVGQERNASQVVFVESSTTLVDVAAAPGPVLADGANAFVYHRVTDGDPVRVEKSTGQETVLADGALTPVPEVQFTPRGVLVVTAGVLKEWRDGVPATLASGIAAGTLRVRGSWAIWMQGGTIYRRDLEAATTIAIGVGSAPDLAANGDVVFENGALRRYRAGVTTPLTSAVFTDPVTDGVNVAYRSGSRTFLTTPTGTIELATLSDSATVGLDYAVAGGWTAFTRQTGDSARNVWVRSPAGVETQVTFYNTLTGIVSLDGNGRVVISRPGRLGVTGPGENVRDVARQGAAFWRDGVAHLIIGASVFRVDESAPPPPTSCTSSLSVTGITVTGAHQNIYVGDAVQVRATVTSACQLTQVVAEGLESSVVLAFQSGEWRGTLSLAGRPSGPFTLTVRATDVNATTAQRTLNLTRDTPPVVTLTRPTPSQVGRPSLRVTASCTDDGPGGCTSLQVRTGGAGGDGQLLASGISSIDQDVSLAAYDGRQGLTLIVYSRDSVGQERAFAQTVFVESSTVLVDMASAPGPVLADATDALVYHSVAEGDPILVEKSTGQTTVLADGPVGSVPEVQFTPRGALVVTSGTLREWRDGAPVDLASGVEAGTLRVRGGWAVWKQGGRLYRRDLEAGTTISLRDGSGADVAANGDVAYSDTGTIMRYRAGVFTALTDSGYYVDPATDGINVAYGSGNRTYVRTPTGTSELATLGNTAKPGLDYAVAGGWTAFTRQAGAARNVWVRSPGGVETQLTFYNAVTGIAALDDNGRVVITRNGQLGVTGPGETVRDIAKQGSAFWRAGVAHVIIGASVFRVDESTPPPPTSCTSSLSVNSATVTNAYQSTYVGDAVGLRATVSSICQLQEVRAEGLGSTVALTFQSSEWRGTLSLAGRPHGPFTLTVTATDINGTTAQRTLELTHDTGPVVTLTRPTPYQVGRPLLRVTASCSDDGPSGCTSLQVRTGGAGGDGQLLASGTSSIDQDVSLATYDGRQSLTLIVYGRDALGQERSAAQPVFAESSTALIEVAAAPGPVLADAVDALVYHRIADGDPVRVEKGTGQETVLADGPVPPAVPDVQFTPRGVLVVTSGALREWRDGVPIDLASGVVAGSLRVRGGWAVWRQGGQVYRRDLEAGTTIAIGGGSDPDVAVNGDVVYTDSGTTRRYRAGVLTALPGSGSSVSPLTDGINVAFAEGSRTYLITPNGTSDLATLTGTARAGLDYAVAGGWVAFTRQADASARNVWVRSPAGVDTQVTFFNGVTGIAALNDNGRVVITRNGQLGVTGPGETVRDIAGQGKAFWRDGSAHVIIGASVFRVASPIARANVAASVNGGLATAVDEYDGGFGPAGANDGDRRGANLGNNGGWMGRRNPTHSPPDWLEVAFAGVRTIDEVCVVSAQDNWRAPIEPNPGTSFTQYGILDFRLESWDGNAWRVVPGTTVTGNAQVVRCLPFAAVTTSRIRLVVTRTPDGYARVIELEAWSAATGQPPVVTVSNLTSEPIVAGVTTVQLSATASDSDGTVSKVDFYANGQLLGTDASSPYTQSWTPGQAGTYQVTAVATDNHQATTTSTAIAISVVVASNPTRTNVAWSGNGGVATAVNEYDGGFGPAGANDGDRRGTNLGNNGGWMGRRNPTHSPPDWLRVDFAGMRTIDEVCVVSAQDNWRAPIEPNPGTSFTLYGILDFRLESWDGNAWRAVPGTTVTDNAQVVRCLPFAAVTTSRIRLVVTRTPDGYARVIELEAWSAATGQPPAPPANTPPVVTVSNLTSEPIVAGVTTVQLSATASDSDGTVSKVDFYANGQLLGTDASSPYTQSWTPGQAGTYQVTAVATDNSQATTTSTAIAIPVVVASNPTRTNVAWSGNGGVATAVNEYDGGFGPAGANDGNRRGTNLGNNGGWMGRRNPTHAPPDWLRVDFAGMQTVDEVCVISAQDNWRAPVEPDAATPFTLYGVLDFNVEYDDGGVWRPVAGAGVTNNTQVVRCVPFAAITTSRIRVVVTRTPDGYARLIELEAWSAAPATSTPPTVTLSNLTSGPIIAGVTAVALRAEAGDSDGTITKVDFYAHGQLVGTDAGSPYTLTWTPGLAGTYRFTAVATDNSQVTTTSAEIEVVVAPNPARTNVALASNGSQATAVNQVGDGFRADGAINGDRRGANIGNNDGWVSQRYALAAWLQVDFAGPRTIDAACVVGAQDNWRAPVIPDESLQSTLYGLLDFHLESWTGAAWQPIPGAVVTGNSQVVRCLEFQAVTTSRLRLVVARTPDGYARVIEFEALGTP